MNIQDERRIVIEHNITSNSDGKKFAPVIIDGSHFGDDFNRFDGETHIHDDGMCGDTPVTFHQTFLTTHLSDEELLHKFNH